ncbi:MAG: permease [Bacillota bacterium]
MKTTTITLLITVVILLLVLFYLGGSSLVIESLNRAWETAMRAFFLIIIAFVVIGQLQVLITSDMIKEWLNKYSGNKSVIVSSLAGGLFPGGPYIFYPFLAGFKGKGIPFFLIFSFVAGKQSYDVTRLPLEASLTTPGLAILRNIITFPFPILMGFIARRYFPEGFNNFSQEEVSKH